MISDYLSGAARLAAIASLGALAACSESALSQASEVSANDLAAKSKEQLVEHSIGDEYTPCEDCPIFVRVPDAPDSLRPIRYVSKYELTWNHFLAAYEDGSCELPKRWGWGGKDTPIVRSDPVFESLRLDWAITTMGPSDIICYQEWFKEKTGQFPMLPSSLEWEWFARAGVRDRKYPWGNEPDSTQEALDVSSIRDKLLPAQDLVDLPPRIRKIAVGAEVGLFEPNDWGLHDLLGNAKELTNEVITAQNVEQYNARLGRTLNVGGSRGRVTKGFVLSTQSERWKQGIGYSDYMIEMPTGFSTSVGVRFVLVEGQ